MLTNSLLTFRVLSFPGTVTCLLTHIPLYNGIQRLSFSSSYYKSVQLKQDVNTTEDKLIGTETSANNAINLSQSIIHQQRLLNDNHVSIEQSHSVPAHAPDSISELSSRSIINESAPYGGGPSKQEKKEYRKEKHVSLPKWFNKAKYTSTNSICSFVYTYKEMACVTMNKDFEVTDIHTEKFSSYLRQPSQYWGKVSPFVDKVPSDSLCLIEHISLPAKFYQVNLHHRSITMLLYGLLQNKEDPYKILSFSRRSVGTLFNLNINKAGSRMDSQMLAQEIVTAQKWNDIDLKIPSSVFFVKENKLYFNEVKGDDVVSRECMQEVSDALLQAIVFWSIANNSFNKVKFKSKKKHA